MGHWVWQVLGWLALALNVWGNLALTGKGTAGWVIRLASNACWVAYSIDTAAWALLVNHVLFAGINIYGWRRWRRETPDHTTVELRRVRRVLREIHEEAGKTKNWRVSAMASGGLGEP